MSELIGKIVCGYKITGEVGEGGMGKVYLAESAFLTEYKQQVAIKTLTSYSSSERQAALLRDLFTREANIQVQFKHPHIVSVIQFAVEEDRLFLILEYMPGYQHRGRRISNIADVIHHETGPIHHRRALKMFVQTLDAMHYAHNFKYRWEGEERVGIVHRDIKPANLLLLDPETVKVSDFGIVKVQQRNPAVTQKLTPGTSAYMAPEAILGPQGYGLTDLDARSDIYALGVTLYEMLAGRLPFKPDPNTNPDVSLRRKHVNDMPPPPSAYYPGIPQAIDDLVMKALRKRPEERYQSAAEFKQAILMLDRQEGLDLLEGARTETFDTDQMAMPTDRIESSSTASGRTLSTTPGAVAGRYLDAASTNVNYAQQATRATAIPAPAAGSSKMLWIVGAAVFALVLAAAGFFLLNRRDAQAGGGAPVAVKPDGMELIPAGGFLMGRNLTDEEKTLRIELEGPGTAIPLFDYDWPAHEKSVAAFYLDRTEVSNQQYAEFVKATGHAPPQDWNGPAPLANTELLPVTWVAYQDAVDYCRWRSEQRKDGLRYRIPTEEEWEYAARGKDAGRPGAPVNLYPWGDQWIDGKANTRESRLARARNVDTGADGRSPFGILNLAGNVNEWTSSDFYHYPGSDRRTPQESGFQGTYQVVRGGGFAYAKEAAMTTTRLWAKPTDKGPKLGFRCAADAKP
ncbi:MAG: bifunctional serine/threonine-protein kinase/formylglycine-generating enzyme family protein [Blastocatellia bacterium]|nr:bifunctional serine/threonine-protein kinase/formylglycine-generating enzyme family protein [Blastocatellia bacterium]